MELVIANIAYKAGIINTEIFDVSYYGAYYHISNSVFIKKTPLLFFQIFFL